MMMFRTSRLVGYVNHHARYPGAFGASHFASPPLSCGASGQPKKPVVFFVAFVIASRGLTCRTLGKGKSSTQNAIFGGQPFFLGVWVVPKNSGTFSPRVYPLKIPSFPLFSPSILGFSHYLWKHLFVIVTFTGFDCNELILAWNWIPTLKEIPANKILE